MGLNDTPSGERIHIGFFGRRNAGKSSLVNAVTGQDLAVVSSKKGTTTDPVYKAMELLPLGPVMIIDTPGYDDKGELGSLRVKKTREILDRTDLAVLVVDAALGMSEDDKDLALQLRNNGIPLLIVFNKADLLLPDETAGEQGGQMTGGAAAGQGIHRSDEAAPEQGARTSDRIYVSSLTGQGIHELKERMAAMAAKAEARKAGPPLVRDLLRPGALAVLVIPIDSAAPKGRIILPQQQVLRDILDGDRMAVCVKETQLKDLLDRLPDDPDMVITDSQVFEEAAAIVPDRVPLTSFSILMARYKGFLETAAAGCRRIDSLQDGDRILISEGCTHHRQCDDIGTVKLPRWLQRYTGKALQIETSSGRSFPEDLSRYALVIHCGGCMLNARELKNREARAKAAGVPFTNYGIAIAHMKGILERSIRDVLPAEN